MSKTEKIDKEQAKKDIISAVNEYDNVILLGFKKTGDATMITATEDEIYDKLGLAIVQFLNGLKEEVDKDAKIACQGTTSMRRPNLTLWDRIRYMQEKKR